jgi:TRAP-type transport system periplasmic protein
VRLLKLLAGALLLLQPVAARAQTVWDMPTEYPENAMPGLGLKTFTKHVAELSAGKLQIRPKPRQINFLPHRKRIFLI